MNHIDFKTSGFYAIPLDSITTGSLLAIQCTNDLVDDKIKLRAYNFQDLISAFFFFKQRLLTALQNSHARFPSTPRTICMHSTQRTFGFFFLNKKKKIVLLSNLQPAVPRKLEKNVCLIDPYLINSVSMPSRQLYSV